MPSFQQPTNSSSMCSNFDEEQWVINIRQALDEDLVELLDNENPVHIFTVPPTLMAVDPFSFTPQQVSIGPYHFSRPQLSEMEAYKVAAARRNQMKLQNDLKLQNLVDQVIRHEPHIRASYHKFLNFSSETLAWMMAVDASFLLDFLQICAISAGGKGRDDISSKKLSHLVNLSHNTTNNAILRDIIMLENQIPLCVLRKLLELHFSSVEKADEMLHLMLTGLCEDLSPFKMEESWPKIKVKKCAHLVDVLYRYAVPKLEGFSDIAEVEENVFQMDEESENCGEKPEDKDFIYRVWRRMSGSKGTEELTEEIANPLKTIVKFPSFLTKIALIRFVKEAVQQVIDSTTRSKDNKEQENISSNSLSAAGIISKPPLLEEIEIPCVTELVKAGVRFKPTNKGIESINFDVKTCTFFLPIINLDMNSPVVLKNLVAYEACSANGPLVLTRYTELMNGIIDTEEDAKYLREKGIVINRLKTDVEVTNLCNGMCKSIRLTKVPRIDKVIEDVNKFYSGRWKVKFRRYMKKYVFESWRLLTFIGAVLMILLMAFQAFCSVYNCSRFMVVG